MNYVGKVISNQWEKIAPLGELLEKNFSWHSGYKQEIAFKKIKEVLVSKRCLMYYDINKPVRIQMDTSRSGIDAALIQDGKPDAYASK